MFTKLLPTIANFAKKRLEPITLSIRMFTDHLKMKVAQKFRNPVV
jgi:hypothetical protein